MSNKHYGWRQDNPDFRDQKYAAPLEKLGKLPPSIDLRPHCPPVYDQGQLGSCTANAIAAAVEFEQMREKLNPFLPSRLFIYYNERVMEGTIDSDAGASLRDGIKSVATIGVCPESMWTYNIERFRDKPMTTCYDTAKLDKAVLYQSIKQNLLQMKGCLAAGHPFVLGFTVYDSFESQEVADTGVVNLPTADEQVQGGHAVLAVGYNDKTKRFLVRNSWGIGWGMAGYFTMPYTYLTNANLADDFWVIKIVTDVQGK